MSTATEIILRMAEMQPIFDRFHADVERCVIVPLIHRMRWRLHLYEAGRSARRQLTYTPKE